MKNFMNNTSLRENYDLMESLFFYIKFVVLVLIFSCKLFGEYLEKSETSLEPRL